VNAEHTGNVLASLTDEQLREARAFAKEHTQVDEPLTRRIGWALLSDIAAESDRRRNTAGAA
jgi:hypothetical protein